MDRVWRSGGLTGPLGWKQGLVLSLGQGSHELWSETRKASQCRPAGARPGGACCHVGFCSVFSYL